MPLSRHLALALTTFALSLGLAVSGPGAAVAAPAHPRVGGQHDPAGPSTHRGEHHASGWYLALGDSLAAGYQPGVGDDRDGGYVDDVLAAVRSESPKTRLVNLSCSGESTVTMVQGGVCAYAKGNQLQQAVHFLRAHGRTTRLVTITIGANDVQHCVRTAIDYACIASGMADIARELPFIVKRLHHVAPRTRIIVTNYYNPFLAEWLLGPAGQQLALASTALLGQLNGLIAVGAAAGHAFVADVSTAFSSTDFTDTEDLPGVGTVPLNVARICTWTWMCTKADDHPNDTGYDVLGQTIVAALEQ